MSILEAHAAPAAATTSVTQQDGGGGGNPAPAIVCDIPSVGDALLGEALVSTAIACSGVENQLQVSATWVDMATGQVLSSDSQTITTPTFNYERQDSINRGTVGARTFTFCMTASAVGFQPASACNTLTGL